jgi:hypothetical protein
LCYTAQFVDLRTRVIDQAHERDLLQVGENSKFPAVLGCKVETVAMRDEKPKTPYRHLGYMVQVTSSLGRDAFLEPHVAKAQHVVT